MVKLHACIFIVISIVLIQTEADHFEYLLYKHLLKNYTVLERPVSNNTYPLRVTVGVVLQQIIGVDEKNQIIEVNAWIKYAWSDYKLKWEPKQYGGITDVRFPVGLIWQPDILLYNSADTKFDSTFPSNLVVYYDGTVNWIPPGILKSSCKIDITWFPFDDQSCYLKFGSWTYHGFALDLQPESKKGMDTSEYLTNGEFVLLSTPVKRSEQFYDCCPEPYPDLKFYINIRRRTLYYGFNLIVPSLLISFMTLLGFTLPPDAGEKITLEITILLSVCFFLSIVADMIPPTSEAVPLIGTFFTCCMLVVSASVVFTVVVLNLHYRSPDTHEMNKFVKVVLLNWLPWLLMMKRPGQQFHKPSCKDLVIEPRKGSPPEEESFLSTSLGLRGLVNGTNIASSLLSSTHVPMTEPGQHDLSGRRDSEESNGTFHRLSAAVATHRRQSISLETRIHKCMQPVVSRPNTIDPGVHSLILMMERIVSELKFITKRMEKEDEDCDAENDWKFAAMVIDRLCLIIFSAFIIGSTCGIMFSAPHLFA